MTRLMDATEIVAISTPSKRIAENNSTREGNFNCRVFQDAAPCPSSPDGHFTAVIYEGSCLVESKTLAELDLPSESVVVAKADRRFQALAKANVLLTQLGISVDGNLEVIELPAPTHRCRLYKVPAIASNSPIFTEVWDTSEKSFSNQNNDLPSGELLFEFASKSYKKAVSNVRSFKTQNKIGSTVYWRGRGQS